MIGIIHRRKGSQPCVSVRVAGPLPKPLVAYAQTPASTAVTAALDGTDRELFAPKPFRRRGRDEHVDVRAAVLLPGVVVALAEPSGARLADAARHLARRGVEYQRTTLGNEDVHPELRSNGGHPLAQQPRSRGRR